MAISTMFLGSARQMQHRGSRNNRCDRLTHDVGLLKPGKLGGIEAHRRATIDYHDHARCDFGVVLPHDERVLILRKRESRRGVPVDPGEPVTWSVRARARDLGPLATAQAALRAIRDARRPVPRDERKGAPGRARHQSPLRGFCSQAGMLLPGRLRRRRRKGVIDERLALISLKVGIESLLVTDRAVEPFADIRAAGRAAAVGRINDHAVVEFAALAEALRKATGRRAGL